MNKSLKKGDRVNVKMIIEESWESEAEMLNGVFLGYHCDDSYYIEWDRNTKSNPYARALRGGYYWRYKYSVEKIN